MQRRHDSLSKVNGKTMLLYLANAVVVSQPCPNEGSGFFRRTYPDASHGPWDVAFSWAWAVIVDKKYMTSMHVPSYVLPPE